MLRRLSWLDTFVITLFIMAIPVGKVVRSASSQVSREQDQSHNTVAYHVNLPIILTLDERPFLMAIYNSTYGNTWTNNSGWNTNAPYCTWYGVTCDSTQHVTSLILRDNQVYGPLPPEFRLSGVFAEP